MFKFDTHVHTSETSLCGVINAEDTIKLYIDEGFSGLCITDHYNKHSFDGWSCNSWDNTISKFLEGYHKAKNFGDKNNFNVLLGAELKFEGSQNEYLTFGITEDFLYKYPKLYDYKISDFRKLANDNGIMVFQAHPFRPNLTRENPAFLDGVEVFNGNFRHNSQNDLAYKFCRENNLIPSGGSDCHQIEDVGNSGILTKHKIKNSYDLINIFKTRKHDIITI